ncbi:MAG: acyl-ACP--UDP-N-acetylglucosamine O-acyltransferase [Candidatus Omnitrophica bacterium]|nr:acyl-ACP--UDP-N-acetylglucosamine O-acyltransferase [Candidatus Omnitrophota bacterium]MBU1871855.1 acyl-ACP--UDP-N-acetylglucosamine O-acyltransferase [Candidatus Omnitrophota bacterium]
MKIHSTAIVSKKAELGKGVVVRPYAIIGDGVKIGVASVIGPHCVIEGNTTIGKRCQVFNAATVGSSPQDLKYKGEDSFLEIGDDNIIREYVTINPGTEENSKTTVGNNNLIMAYSHIAHNCEIGNNCIIANAGTLAGYVRLEDRVVVGGLVAIHQFTRVGTLSIIGGCSKVVSDVPPYSTCDGHPARVYGLNLVGLRRQKISKGSIKELSHAFKILFNSGLTVGSALKNLSEEKYTSAEISHLINFIKGSKRGVCRHR